MRSVDVHTHGIGGFDTRQASVDALARAAALHGAAGVSDIVLSIYPDSIPKMRGQMELVHQTMERQRSAFSSQPSAEISRPRPRDPGADTAAARIIGIHLEGPFLNRLHCGALNPSFFIDPDQHFFERLTDGFEDVIRVITIAPELQGAEPLIRNACNAGIVVSMGHSDATYAEAEAGFNAGARGITHLFNAMRGIHHREPGLAGFGLLHEEVYAEVIADPFHIHKSVLELIFRTKKKSRILLISDSVAETVPGGAPSVTDASGRLQGGSMTIPEAARRLIDLGFDTEAVMRAISTNPASYLNITAEE